MLIVKCSPWIELSVLQHIAHFQAAFRVKQRLTIICVDNIAKTTDIVATIDLKDV